MPTEYDPLWLDLHQYGARYAQLRSLRYRLFCDDQLRQRHLRVRLWSGLRAVRRYVRRSNEQSPALWRLLEYVLGISPILPRREVHLFALERQTARASSILLLAPIGSPSSGKPHIRRPMGNSSGFQ